MYLYVFGTQLYPNLYYALFFLQEGIGKVTLLTTTSRKYQKSLLPPPCIFFPLGLFYLFYSGFRPWVNQMFLICNSQKPSQLSVPAGISGNCSPRTPGLPKAENHCCRTIRLIPWNSESPENDISPWIAFTSLELDLCIISACSPQVTNGAFVFSFHFKQKGGHFGAEAEL